MKVWGYLEVLGSSDLNANFAEYTAHAAASSSVHGVSGSVVGTSGIQTLFSKTLSSPNIQTPTISTPSISNASLSGTLTSTLSSVIGNLPEFSIAAAQSTPTANRMVSEAIIKAWGYITSGASINASYNISSVSRPTTGTYLITLKRAFSSSNYVVVASSENQTVICAIQPVNSSSFYVYTTTSGGSPGNVAFHFMAMGAQ